MFSRRKKIYEQNHKDEERSNYIQSLVKEIKETEEKLRESNVPIKFQLAKALMGLSVLSLPIAIFVFLLVTFWNLPDTARQPP